MNKKFLIVNLIAFLLILVGDIFYITTSALLVKGLTSVGFVALGLFNLICVLKTGTDKKKFSIIMFAGLCFGMLGDILLEIEFITGAVLFAVGHVLYFIAYCFLQKFDYKDIVAGLIIFVPSMLFIVLAPIFDFGGNLLKILCVVYALFISFMLGKSIANLIKEKNLLNILICVGSSLFFFSDLMLLFNVFANLFSLARVLCLITYYPAQCLLAFALLITQKTENKKIN